jgi:hypothetical protein
VFVPWSRNPRQALGGHDIEDIVFALGFGFDPLRIARKKVIEMANSETYNDIPETRGTARNKGHFEGLTEQEQEIARKLAAFKASQEAEGR